jgi:methylenetetrahydrofolate reductase (NADPH)
MTAMAHLTCAAHTRAELRDIVGRYHEAGVENILALGGDPPANLDLPPGDLRHAHELVELVQEEGPFTVGVAAHPELHPSSPDRTSDRDHLAAKLRMADFGITQFFFRCEDYFRMVDELAALGVDTPVLAGIIPVTNLGQVERFAKLAGADFPRDFAEKLEAVAHDPNEVRRIGVEKAIELTSTLLEAGVPGIHFYTLNFPKATREIYAALGLGPR